MWAIFEGRKALKQLKKCPHNIKKEYETWKKVIEFSSPQALRAISGYRDHALKGQWSGARSSALGYNWRVIYFIDKKRIEVKVLEVTPHDYRKKN
jgi:toxin HigB-1